MLSGRLRRDALARIRPEHLDFRQLAHALIESYREVATVPVVHGDDEAISDPSRSCLEPDVCSRDSLAILEGECGLIQEAARRQQSAQDLASR